MANIPKRISDYLIYEMIGSGSFSNVYLGESLLARRPVAIKVVPKVNLRTDEEMDSFELEISISSKMDHPLIVHFFDVVEDMVNFYIVMEYVENDSLLNYVNNNGGLSEDESRNIFKQLVTVVKYLHNEIRVVHRDLKAENVMLDSNRNIRLIDFGLSTSFTNSTQMFNTKCGSPAYVAPELVQGQPYTQLVDVWSLGILLYAMATGHLPFEDDNLGAQLKKIMFQDPEYPDTLSPLLVDLLKRLLSKNPDHRIRLNEISNHPWLSSYTVARMNIDLTDEIKNEIHLKTLEELKASGVNCTHILLDLDSGKVTRETAVYRIIRRHYIQECLNSFQTLYRSHKSTLPTVKRSAVSQYALPKLEIPSSRQNALANARGNVNVMSVPNTYHVATYLRSSQRRPSRVPSHMMSYGSPPPDAAKIRIKRRSRALTFDKDCQILVKAVPN